MTNLKRYIKRTKRKSKKHKNIENTKLKDTNIYKKQKAQKIYKKQFKKNIKKPLKTKGGV